MSVNLDTARSLAAGHGKVYDAAGNKIGSVGQVYVDDETGEPNWVTVKTGLFGLSETFVPLAGARAEGVDLYVTAGEDDVKAAPRIDPDGSLTPAEEQRLYDYYASLETEPGSADSSATAESSTRRDDQPSRAADPAQYAGPEDQRSTEGAAGRTKTDDENRSVARDERPPVSGQRLRLRKYVVTEEATVTVPVQREEIRLEPEPDDDAADSDHAGPSERGDR